MRRNAWAPVSAVQAQTGPASSGRPANIIGAQVPGVQVDGDVQLLDPFPEGQKSAVVEIVAIGLAVDQCTSELQVLDGSLQFVSCRLGILQGDRRESTIAQRPLLDFARQKFVGQPGEAYRRGPVLLTLDARRGERQNGHLDTGRIHGAQPQVVEIDQAALDIGEHRIAVGRPRHKAALLELGQAEMLLERDLGRAGSLPAPILSGDRLRRHLRRVSSIDAGRRRACAAMRSSVHLPTH